MIIYKTVKQSSINSLLKEVYTKNNQDAEFGKINVA